MATFLLGVGLFSAAFALHVVVWRLHRPRRPYVALATLFLVVVPAVAAVAGALCGVSPSLFGGWSGLVSALLCHVALSLAYIVTYTAIESDSATLTIALALARAGEKGRSQADIQNLFDDDFVIGARLKSLVDTGYLRLQGDRLTITEQGRGVASLYRLVRRLYHLQVGG
ncbi:MAG: hypothetical protein K8U03_11210 [Planctomycetia bacterium]|nr:hypothetical protein [Planctomycetia bacterium]